MTDSTENDTLPRKRHTPQSHQIQILKFLGTNSCSTKISISISICTARYRDRWVSRLCGLRGCSIFSENCDTIFHLLLLFHISCSICWYGVASISRLLEMIGVFCKRALQKRLYSAKETYHFKEPTNRSHPMYIPLMPPHIHHVNHTLYIVNYSM